MPKPKRHTSRFEVRLSPELHQSALEKATRLGKSLSEVIRELLQHWLKEK